MAALWLLVAAPTVSRVLPVWLSGDLGAWCTAQGFTEEHDASPDKHATHAELCGYCVLLTHAPLLDSATAPLALVAWLPAPTPVVLARWRWHPLPQTHVHPRGPPSSVIG